MGFEVPMPGVVPGTVRVMWTPTGSAVIVECVGCGISTAIYTTVLRANPAALCAAVMEHEGCRS